MTTISKIALGLGVLFLGSFLYFSPHDALARETAVGKVVFVRGEAFVTRLPIKQPQPLVFKDNIYQMDILETGDGELKIRLNDRSILRLFPNSKILVTEHVFHQARGQRKSIFEIAKGSVRTIIQQLPTLKKNDVRLQTPAAVAAIRGTDVVTVIKEKKKGDASKGVIAQFFLDSGLLDVYSLDYVDTIVQVKPGYFVTVHEGFPPSAPTEMSATMRKSFFSDTGNLSEVLKLLSAPKQPSSTPEETSALPPTFGDTETNPGAQQRTLPTSAPEGVDEGPGPASPGQPPPGQAPVKVPVTFEERR